MQQQVYQRLKQDIKEIDDAQALSEIADTLEQLVHEMRRQMMPAHEQDILSQIRACYQAQKMRTYFNQSHLPDNMAINLVNLDALHWIEKLPEPQPSTIGFSNYKGLAYYDPNERYNNKLRSAWRKGTPYRVTTYGTLSLANGYLFMGLTGREISEGFDGYNKRSQEQS